LVDYRALLGQMIEIKVGYDSNEILTKIGLIYLCRDLKRKPNSIRLPAKVVWGRKTTPFSPVFVEFFAEYSRFRLQNSP